MRNRTLTYQLDRKVDKETRKSCSRLWSKSRILSTIGTVK